MPSTNNIIRLYWTPHLNLSFLRFCKKIQLTDPNSFENILNFTYCDANDIMKHAKNSSKDKLR